MADGECRIVLTLLSGIGTGILPDEDLLVSQRTTPGAVGFAEGDVFGDVAEAGAGAPDTVGGSERNRGDFVGVEITRTFHVLTLSVYPLDGPPGCKSGVALGIQKLSACSACPKRYIVGVRVVSRMPLPVDVEGQREEVVIGQAVEYSAHRLVGRESQSQIIDLLQFDGFPADEECGWRYVAVQGSAVVVEDEVVVVEQNVVRCERMAVRPFDSQRSARFGSIESPIGWENVSRPSFLAFIVAGT